MPPVGAPAIAQTEHMNNILLIQSHRRNDLLQTTPALTALRRGHPGARISVLVQASASDALVGNPDLDEVIAWNTESLTVAPEDGTAPLARAKEDLRQFVHSLRARNFDTVYNFSDDLPSALLTYLLKPRKVAGLTFCKDRRYRVRNEWLRYLFLATELRHMNTLNLGDIFVETCESAEELAPRIATEPEDEQFAEETLQTAFGYHVRPVLLHLPPSEEAQSWPAEQFGQLAAALQHKGAPIVLLGSRPEEGAGAQIAAQVPFPAQTLNLVGAATLPQTAALLKRCLYLVAGDPVTPQIAAATHTPCLVISAGYYCPWDLGPYGDGHYVIEPADACFPCYPGQSCSDAACRRRTTVEAALAAIRYMQSPDSRDIPPALCNDAVIFSRSTWMPDGMLGLQALNRPALTLPTLLRAVFRACTLTSHLPVTRRVPEAAWRPWSRELFSWYKLTTSRTLLDGAEAAKRELDTLSRTAEDGAEACRGIVFPRSPDTHPLSMAEGIITLMNDLRLRVLKHEGLESAGVLVTAFRHALRDTDDLPLAQAVAVRRALYQNLAHACEFMRQALDEFITCAAEQPPDN